MIQPRTIGRLKNLSCKSKFRIMEKSIPNIFRVFRFSLPLKFSSKISPTIAIVVLGWVSKIRPDFYHSIFHMTCIICVSWINLSWNFRKSKPKLSSLKVLKTWYGEADIATLVNYPLVWDDRNTIYNESKMFDNDPTTLWIANDKYTSEDKIIGVEFKVFFFLRISWFKIQFDIKLILLTTKFMVQNLIRCLGTYWIFGIDDRKTKTGIHRPLQRRMSYYRWRYRWSKLHRYTIGFSRSPRQSIYNMEIAEKRLT